MKKNKTKTIKSLAEIPESEPAPGELPEMRGAGVEKLVLPLLEKLAEKVSDLCEERKRIGEKEGQEREKLLNMMDEHKLLQYPLESGNVVYVNDKRKAVIKSSSEDLD